jgi:hypothetical protein
MAWLDLHKAGHDDGGSEHRLKKPNNRSCDKSRESVDIIRNICHMFRLTESNSRSPKDWREDEKLWLFETLARNLTRERRRGGDFLAYIARNPLKRLDSQK